MFNVAVFESTGEVHYSVPRLDTCTSPSMSHRGIFSKTHPLSVLKPGEEGGRSSLSAGPARWVVAAPLASGAVFSPLTVAGQVLSYTSPRESPTIPKPVQTHLLSCRSSPRRATSGRRVLLQPAVAHGESLIARAARVYRHVARYLVAQQLDSHGLSTHLRSYGHCGFTVSLPHSLH